MKDSGPRWRRLVGGSCALALLLSGCGSGDTAPEIDPDELGLSAEITNWRPDDDHTVRVQFANRGGHQIRVETLKLIDPGFVPKPATKVDDTLPRKYEVALPVRYGAARCGEKARHGRTEVVARVRTDDGTRTVRFDFKPRPAILRLRQKHQCGERAVRAAVTVELVQLRRSGTVVVAEVRLRRRASAGVVKLTQVDGNIIFGLRAERPDEPLATLEPDQRTAAVRVRIHASRCDTHGLLDSKKTFEFPVYIQVDDSDPHQIIVIPQAKTRAMLNDLIETCKERTQVD